MKLTLSTKGINSQAAGLEHTRMYEEDSDDMAVGFASSDSFAPRKKRAADALRTGGAFLPAAGYRNGSTVNNAGTNGNYWSSSPNASNVNNAYNVNFNSGNLNPANNNNRNNGHSVRLVRQVESTYTFLSR